MKKMTKTILSSPLALMVGYVSVLNVDNALVAALELEKRSPKSPQNLQIPWNSMGEDSVYCCKGPECVCSRRSRTTFGPESEELW